MKKLMLEKEEQYKKDLEMLAKNTQKVDFSKDSIEGRDNGNLYLEEINELKLQVTTLEGEKDAN